jgi:hypothetical protein
MAADTRSEASAVNAPPPATETVTAAASPAIARTAAGVAASEKSAVGVTVNGWVAVPRDEATVRGPVTAPIGTVVVIVAGVTVRTEAATPLKVTVAPGSKLRPVMVTTAPMEPLAGVTAVIAGPKSTVNVRVAGVGSSLPARSAALTAKVCTPSVRCGSAALVCAEDGLQAPPSRRQANTRLPAGVRLSSPANVMITAASSGSPPVMRVSGGVLSTTTARVAERVFPA